MSFLLLGTTLALAAHLLASVACSVVVAVFLTAFETRLGRLEAGARASAFLGLALLPAAAGALVTGAIVAPAWIAREPWGADEAPGRLLLAAAALGALLVVLRTGAGLRLLRRAARAESEWTRRGRAVHGLPLPATRFEHELPVAALVGVFRPRLLIADRLVRALDRAELGAVAAHELGHLAGRDNLRRLLLAASPDPLAWTAIGARLRRRFEEAAEAAADRHACGLVPPLRLAQALLKAAALVPAGRRLEVPLASFNDDGPLAARVRALVASDAPAAARTRLPLLGAGVGALSVAGVCGLVALAAVRPEVHRLLEAAVRLLP